MKKQLTANLQEIATRRADEQVKIVCTNPQMAEKYPEHNDLLNYAVQNSYDNFSVSATSQDYGKSGCFYTLAACERMAKEAQKNVAAEILLDLQCEIETINELLETGGYSLSEYNQAVDEINAY